MTKEQLAEQLDRLDPGATCTVEVGELARAFGADTLTGDVVRAVEAFAVDHRSTFSYDEHGQGSPCFEKGDIF